MADSKQNRCPRCGAPKTTEATGSLTQWIAVCRCDMKALAPTEHAETMHFCATCGKRINPGRAGSLTQWILRGDICGCQNPAPTVFGQGRLGAPGVMGRSVDSQEGASDDAGMAVVGGLELEPELEVSPESFPRERYKALELIGEGGSGRVYRCLDRLLENQVAIKLLLSLNRDQVISFQKEAKAGSVLQHEGLVSVRDFGVTASGAPFMVMDFVPGISLDRYIEEEGPLTEIEAVDVFSKVADALSYAHQKNIFHRDMKTSNIIVSLGKDNEAVANVIDFGISSFSQEQTMFSGNTLTGTPAYMPPDQASGLPFDARSEVYALGCVIFEALTGQVPFSGDTALATIGMHANKPAPRLVDMAEHIQFSEKFENIVARCLAKNPDNRFQSMQALREALLREPDELSVSEAGAASSLFTLPERAEHFAGGSGADKKVLIIAFGVITVLVLFVVGLCGLVNVIASRSPENEMKIKSAMDDTDMTEFTAAVRKHIDDSVINDTERVQWKGPGVVKIREGVDQDINYLLTQKEQPLSVINMVGGNFSDESLKGISRLPLAVWFVTDVDLSNVGEMTMSKLKYANFTACKFPQNNPFKMLGSSPLKSLVISNSVIDNGAFQTLKHLKQLTHLSLHGCAGVTDGWQNGINLVNVSWLAKNLSTYPEEGLRHLMGLPHLTGLSLSSDCLTDEQFDQLSKLKLDSLLLVGGKRVSDENLEKLSHSPDPDFKLAFKFDCIDMKSFRALSGRKWKQLGFYETNLRDADLERLAILDSDEFIFDEPSITFAGISKLMKRHPLKLLSLGKLCTNFSRDQMFEVQKLQPNCVVRYANEHGDLVELRNKGQTMQPLPESLQQQ